MTDTIDMRVTIDASQANRALDETRKRAENLGGAKESLGKQLTQMKEKLEKSAGAFAALSLAMGQSNDATGKVLSSVGQLAAAYGAGGSLALGLAAGAAAVSALNKHWDELIKKQDELIEKQYAFTGALAATNKAVTQQRVDAERALQVARLGYDPSTSTISGISERYKPQIAAAEAALEKAKAQPFDYMQPDQVALYTRGIRIAMDTLQEVTDARRAEIDALKAKWKIEREAAAAEAERVRIIREQNALAAGVRYGKDAMGLAENAAQQDLAALIAQASDGARSWYPETNTVSGGSILLGAGGRVRSPSSMTAEDRAFNITLEKRKAAWADANLFMAENWRATQADVVQASLSTTGALVGVFQGYLDAKITAEREADRARQNRDEAAYQKATEMAKDADAALASSALKTIGDQLVGLGTQTAFKGVGYMIESAGFDPRGAGLLALGAAEIAAGVGMGAGAAAIRPLPSASYGGTTTDPARIGTTGGAGRSSHYGGGGTVINIVYGGASGPTADQGAQAVVQGLRRAGRRGLTPVEVR